MTSSLLPLYLLCSATNVDAGCEQLTGSGRQADSAHTLLPA